MRKTRETLRLKWQQCRGHRAVVKALGVGLGTVSDVVGRARRAGITNWQEVEALSEEELEARMYPAPSTIAPRPLPSPAAIHIELRRKGVTLRLLHEEYFRSSPNAYGATRRSSSCTTSGRTGCGSRCARSTRPARNASSTTPATS